MEKIALLVTEEQKETIYSLFGYYNWDVNLVDSDNEIAKVTTKSTQTSDIVHEEIEDEIEQNQFLIEQDQECEECPFCFCKPCITSENNRQMWWESEPQGRHQRNHSLRKEKYKYFWTVMFHREAWKDDRYLMRKQAALERDPEFKNYTWYQRDIMPNCVLKLVRGWHPNSENITYMGHLWE
ncbi:unnamed protein product [Mytilus coruscus]|uniref:Uncharacterized protein n=1 Tax=Mytilus coruscus TaxID=42192 RepID=A0A6J8DRX3_MYTCO|nr:unnamed protein product [Mytilus coruscus]